MVNTKNVHEMLDGKYISHVAIGHQEWLYKTWKWDGACLGRVLVYRVRWAGERLEAEYLAQSRRIYSTRRDESVILCSGGRVEVAFED